MWESPLAEHDERDAGHDAENAHDANDATATGEASVAEEVISKLQARGVMAEAMPHHFC